MAEQMQIDAADRQHQAAAWVARLQSGDASAEDRHRFRLWLREAPENQTLYGEFSRLWGDLSEVELPEGHLQKLQRRRALPRRIATVLAVCGMGYLFAQTPYLDRWRADHFTVTGEVRQITLADGSAVTLNTDSALQITMGAEARRITVLRGEAYFDVVSDPERPFVVDTQGLTATVLGTRFSAGEMGAARDQAVLVAEGRVRVSAGEARRVLGAGDSARDSDAGTLPPVSGDVDQLLAWCHGTVVFSDTVLSDILAVLERYRGGQIMVLGEELAAMHVSGAFDLTDVEAALDTLALSLSLQVHRLGGGLAVVPK